MLLIRKGTSLRYRTGRNPAADNALSTGLRNAGRFGPSLFSYSYRRSVSATITPNQMEELLEGKMSSWGIGPVFGALSLVYGITMAVISDHFYPVFTIGFIPNWLTPILGIALIVIGVPFFLISRKTIKGAYSADKLVTDGIYRCCRHPLYASFVFFIVPGIFFLTNSWIGLTTPIFMYIILRLLVKKEETYLEGAFGSEYLEYKKNVPCIVPFGCFKPNHIIRSCI
jgi:protein-S-isoprenylcysteine O-methyltransferase Ste14